MDTINLEVTENAYGTAKEARHAGRIPISYYGKGTTNRSFSVDYQEFRRAYLKGGRSTIMHLTNEKKEDFSVIVQDIQHDPTSDDMIHIDFIAVDLNKTMRTQVPLVFVGISPAVKELSGVLMHSKDSVEVECLAKNLVHEIEVDISSLVDFHSSINVGDIKVPDGITILDDSEINVATVSAPRAAVEETAEEVAEEVAEAPAAEEGENKED